MPLYIKDENTAELVRELARQRGSTKQDAVKFAVETVLQQAANALPLAEKLEKFWLEHPLPPATGEFADKAFFDGLSGDL